MDRVLTEQEWLEWLPREKVGVTIGNFDGVHRGHSKMLKDFVNVCRDGSLLPIAMTFKPHPELYFHPNSDYLLDSYEEKAEKLLACGIQKVVEVDFSKVRHLTGEEFTKLYLIKNKTLSLLWLGYDFSFGCDKSAPNPKYLDGARAVKNSPVRFEGEIVSSSLIRHKIRLGQIKVANQLLDRKFSIKGKVVHGKKLGRKIGFPTVNLDLSYPACLPKLGVYRVSTVLEGQPYDGLMNVGINPSVENEKNVKWEAFILNYKGDLYGEELVFEFEDFIRPEIKFESTEDLARQIKQDIERIKSNP